MNCTLESDVSSRNLPCVGLAAYTVYLVPSQVIRHRVLGLSVSLWLYTKRLWTWCLTNCWWEFRHIYNLGAFVPEVWSRSLSEWTVHSQRLSSFGLHVEWLCFVGFTYFVFIWVVFCLCFHHYHLYGVKGIAVCGLELCVDLMRNPSAQCGIHHEHRN